MYIWERGKKISRNIRPEIRSFEHFPADIVCPVCKTSDDGATVLVPIDGTDNDGICEAQCVHLSCCIPDHYSKEKGILYKLTD
jgi:rubredoxin